MAIEVMVWVLEQEGDLTTSEKFVLLGIANHARPDGSGAFPSLKTLSGYTLLSESTVQRSIKSLEKKGLLSKDSGGGRRSNTYTVHLDYAPVLELKLVDDDPSHGDHAEDAPSPSSLVTVTDQPSQALTKEPLYNRNTTEIEPSKKRDEVWDAIMDACGVNAQTINSNERGRYNKVVKVLKESGATANDIYERVQVYRKKFKGAALTPNAIANHWSELDPSTVHVVDVVTAPKGWDAIQTAREQRKKNE